MRGKRGIIFVFSIFLFCHAQPSDPAEYMIWKSGFLPSHKHSMVPLRIQNDLVAVQVDVADYEIGAFNIGTSSTHPTRPNATLIFAYPSSPGTSHTTFSVDGTYYSYASYLDDPYTRLMTADIPFAVHSMPGDSSYIEGGWIIGDVTILQRLQPVYLVDEYGYSNGSIFIRYTIINNGSIVHSVGIMLQLDTMVGSNDDAPIATSYGFFPYEQEFTSDAMPSQYLAFEVGYPPAPADLVAAGYLMGWDATPPDRFLCGFWPDYNGVTWNYAYIYTGSDEYDTAVLIYWFPRTIAPGETVYVGTYYGLGLEERRPPHVRFVDPTEYDTVACDNQSIIVAVQDSSGVDSTSFVITVNGIEYHYGAPEIRTFRTPGSDTLYFVWQPAPAFFDEPLETVDIAVNVSDVWGAYLLMPAEWHFIVDLEGPYVVDYSIDTGAFVVNRQQPVDIVIEDNFSDVGGIASIVRITTRSGIDRTLAVGMGLSWDGATNTIHVEPADAGILYGYNDSVHIEVVQCFDLTPTEYCGPNNIQPNGIWFFTTEPPEAFLIEPRESTISSCRQQVILIEIQSLGEIVPDSMRLYVNGVPYTTASSAFHFNTTNNLIEFNIDRTVEFVNGVVTLTLSGLYDIYGTPSPSRTWQFFIDALPPAMRSMSPAPVSEVADISFDISFTLADTGLVSSAISGLDTNSVRAWVINSDGRTEVTPYLQRTLNSFVFNTSDVGLSFIDNEIVTVKVFASDNPDSFSAYYCSANSDTLSWSFRIGATPCERTTNPITPDPMDTYNDYTTFKFPNVRSGHLEKKIFIYDHHNRLVRTIENPTSGEWRWDGKDEDEKVVPQGVYIYFITVDGEPVCNGTISVVR